MDGSGRTRRSGSGPKPTWARALSLSSDFDVLDAARKQEQHGKESDRRYTKNRDHDPDNEARLPDVSGPNKEEITPAGSEKSEDEDPD